MCPGRLPSSPSKTRDGESPADDNGNETKSANGLRDLLRAVFFKELKRAASRQLGIGRVVSRAVVVVKSVTRIFIDVHRYLRIRGLDGCLGIICRNMYVFAPEMTDHGALRRRVERLCDHAAVVTRYGSQPLNLAGRQPAHATAVAVSNQEHGAALCKESYAGGNVTQSVFLLRGREDLPSASKPFRSVFNNKATFLAVKHRWRDRFKTAVRPALSIRNDISVNSKYLLDNDNPTPACSNRSDMPCTKPESVFCRALDLNHLSHVKLPGLNLLVVPFPE